MWTPSPDRIARSRMEAFRVDAETATGRALPDQPSLHRWSVTAPEEFWPLVWDRCGVVGERGERVVAPGASFPATRFFPDARLSVVENLLARRGADAAVVAVDETGRRVERSWDELATRAAVVAGGLRALGVEAGDRVVAWLPNGLEAIETMLGAASIGAVFASASPDFGVGGVLDRFAQIEPVVLVAADHYHYGGRPFDCLERLEAIRAGLPTLRATVVVSDDADDLPAGVIRWRDLGAGDAPVAPERFAFDHPWYVMFSSGTTGVPKCIVHRTGGVLLQHVKEHQLHCDLRAGDRLLYFTTTGWMMWNWQVGSLASGVTPVCFDGSPFHPSPTALFDLVDAEGVTLLGVSAKYIDALRTQGVRPADTHGLSSLRTVCSTGSPLSPEGFAHVYGAVKADVHLASIAGGTDLLGCFLAGDPTSPVYAGELQRPALGMAVDAYDEHGRSLADRPGVPGELVCTAPFPSVPLGFWADGTDAAPDPATPGPRFRAAYFEGFDGVWTHGDFASWTEHGGMVIHGRSDATLNPGGVRIGTAEIYRAVEGAEGVVEALVFGQQVGDDMRIVLLVRLHPGLVLDDDLRTDLRARIRRACTPRHVPAVVAQVDDLPRTRSDKLVELAVADAVNGRPVRNTEALANPEAIDAIVALPELRR
nr:acetoacetate--CoA ligase [Rhabdothermincola salaria]